MAHSALCVIFVLRIRSTGALLTRGLAFPGAQANLIVDHEMEDQPCYGIERHCQWFGVAHWRHVDRMECAVCFFFLILCPTVTVVAPSDRVHFFWFSAPLMVWSRALYLSQRAVEKVDMAGSTLIRDGHPSLVLGAASVLGSVHVDSDKFNTQSQERTSQIMRYVCSARDDSMLVHHQTTDACTQFISSASPLLVPSGSLCVALLGGLGVSIRLFVGSEREAHFRLCSASSCTVLKTAVCGGLKYIFKSSNRAN